MVPSIAMEYQQFNLTSVICLHIVKCLNSSIWPIDETLSGTATPGQSGRASDEDEWVFHIPQSSETEASQTDYFNPVPYPGHSLRRGSSPLQICCQNILQPQTSGLKHWGETNETIGLLVEVGRYPWYTNSQ